MYGLIIIIRDFLGNIYQRLVFSSLPPLTASIFFRTPAPPPLKTSVTKNCFRNLDPFRTPLLFIRSAPLDALSFNLVIMLVKFVNIWKWKMDKTYGTFWLQTTHVWKNDIDSHKQTHTYFDAGITFSEILTLKPYLAVGHIVFPMVYF